MFLELGSPQSSCRKNLLFFNCLFFKVLVIKNRVGLDSEKCLRADTNLDPDVESASSVNPKYVQAVDLHVSAVHKNTLILNVIKFSISPGCVQYKYHKQ